MFRSSRSFKDNVHIIQVLPGRSVDLPGPSAKMFRSSRFLQDDVRSSQSFQDDVQIISVLLDDFQIIAVLTIRSVYHPCSSEIKFRSSPSEMLRSSWSFQDDVQIVLVLQGWCSDHPDNPGVMWKSSWSFEISSRSFKRDVLIIPALPKRSVDHPGPSGKSVDHPSLSGKNCRSSRSFCMMFRLSRSFWHDG